MKVKNTIMTISLLLIFVSVTMAGPVSAETVYVQNESYYNGTSMNEQVQSLLDAAKSGDTIEFMGLNYENLHLSINKKLNLISTVGTVIKSSTSAAVFLINGVLASGTQISGFNINTKGSTGIYVKNTTNTVISGNRINSTNGSAITVYKSSNTSIGNSTLTGSAIGAQIENSKNTRITASNITNNLNGLNIENSVNTNITGCN
ncbi:MAG: right-handed parallel beta-helix repeat-containing protein, partial [Methanobacterium paludis]|nr:right-handed parallel beta-helix repeat-containing protein [Methanobacterium paludis]